MTLSRAREALRAGRSADALHLARGLLVDDPSNTQALYISAVAARYMRDYVAANTALDRLKQLSPDFGRAFQETGHLKRAEGHDDLALSAFRLATRYNPALLASWKAQVQLLSAAGRGDEARHARLQAERLEGLPHELVSVTNHIYEGRVFRAEEITRAFLKKHPRHIEGMRLLADIGSRLGVHEDADFLLKAAIELDPDNVQLRIDHIQLLRKRQKYGEALAGAERLAERDPQSALFLSLLAIECMQAGLYERALDLFEQVLEKIPGDPATLTSHGHALKTFGRSADAIAAYRSAIQHDPLHGDAWYALANLKTYRFDPAEIETMRAASARPDLSLMSRVHLAFALGKALEDDGAAQEAFQAYKLGNDLKRQQMRYTTAQMLEEFEAQKRHCTRSLFETRSHTGCLSSEPIFIVGLPRAGSTLIEQILASHSQIDGTLELPDILSLAHRLRGQKQVTERDRYPRILHDLSASELEELGEAYIRTTRIHRRGAPFFTDKMPNNFRHIGLIKLILPNAKIIDARRNPMDCCWSGFKQLFAEGQEFTYGLEEIGTYYRAYVDLMDHWHDVLPPGRILQIQHEDLLEDLEAQVRRLLDYCGLAFEPACLDFHRTERAVRTASAQQVRLPINTRGVGQWRPFEAHLEPLKRALGPILSIQARP